MIKKRARRVMATVAAAAAVGGVGVAVASPANAYPWDSHVHVAGTLSCYNFNEAPGTVSIYADNGESTSAGTSPWGSYGEDLWRVPSGGEGATAVIRCWRLGGGVDTGYRRVWIYRPGFGTQININFGI